MGGCNYDASTRVGISLGLERGRKVYFRESENIAIEMSLNQGRLVHSLTAWTSAYVSLIQVKLVLKGM